MEILVWALRFVIGGGIAAVLLLMVLIVVGFVTFGVCVARQRRERRRAWRRMRAEIKVGEIVAWRAWRQDKRGYLRSVFNSDVWLPGTAMEGDAEWHGVHAWKFEYEAIQYAADQVSPFRQGIVVGSVYLWGDVVEHERGYRAAFARVRSLDLIVPSGHGNLLLDLRRRYGVEEPNTVTWHVTSTGVT